MLHTSLRLIIQFVLPVALSIPGQCRAQTESSLAVTGGQWFDTASGEFKPNPGIFIKEGKFSLIDEEVTDNLPEDCRRVQLGDDEFILPGLVDCHAHYNVRLLDKRREEFFVMPIQYLANGVTTTFSCGEFDPEGMMQLRKDIEIGKKIGPHLINSGPYFGVARRPWHNDPDQVREEVDFWADQGVGGFKAKVINEPCLAALIDQAHQHGLTVTGHLESGFRGYVNPSTAIDLGIDRVEHFLGGDAMTDDRPAYETLAGITPDMPEFQAITKKFIEHGTWFDATITAYGYGSDDKVYEQWYDEAQLLTLFVRQRINDRNNARPPRSSRQFIRIFETKRSTIDDFFRAGGLVSLGTDHVCDGRYLPGFSVHREMHVMVEAGISTADVLRIATINGAKALGIDGETGSIAIGKRGDLAIVTGNPLDDIRNTRNVKYVVRAGTLHDPAELLQSVRGKLGPEDEEAAEDW